MTYTAYYRHQGEIVSQEFNTAAQADEFLAFMKQREKEAWQPVATAPRNEIVEVYTDFCGGRIERAYLGSRAADAPQRHSLPPHPLGEDRLIDSETQADRDAQADAVRWTKEDGRYLVAGLVLGWRTLPKENTP